jgi:hypothetical protein
MPRSPSFLPPCRKPPRRLSKPWEVWVLSVAVGAAGACSGTQEVTPGVGGSAGASPSAGGGSAGVVGAAGGGVGGAGSSPGGAAGSGALGGSSSAGAASAGAAGASAGTAGASAGAGGSGPVTVEPTFATVKRVVELSCFGSPCHDEPGNPLQMKPIDGLITKLGAHTTQDCGPALSPGDPANSAFLTLLKRECGGTARMPLGKCFDDGDPGCVPPEDILAIEKWIENGAKP